MADPKKAPLCDNCRYRAAEIFQVNGDYCLDCWQEKHIPMSKATFNNEIEKLLAVFEQ
jgi:hypothetical protein